MEKQLIENRKIITQNSGSLKISKMHALYSPKNSNCQDEQILLSARSGYLRSGSQDNQRQQDLQLLIRAHQRIRHLEEENAHLKQENQKLYEQIKNERCRLQNSNKVNTKLQQSNQQLLTKMIHLEKDLNKKSINLNQQKDQPKTIENITTHKSRQTFQMQKLNTDFMEQSSKKTDKGSQRALKQSQSTPVILNINVNPFTKEQRNQFLSTCKQEFAKQLSKIKSPDCQVKPKGQLTRNNSQYFAPYLGTTSSQTSQIRLSNFMKQAQQQFTDQNSKTIKNIYCVDRKKSVSSTSGSLIKKNFVGKRYQNDIQRKLFGQKTNIWNSKNASIDQILTGTKNQGYNNNRTSGLKLISPSEHINYIPFEDNENFVKRPNKSIYYNTEFSKSSYTSKDKTFDLKDKKKKQIQLQLRNQQAGGIIKYRGLCL